jgi:hypothetical protein
MNTSAAADWRMVLAAIEQHHAQLYATAEALRAVLVCPAPSRDGDVVGFEWRPGALSEPERSALYESVCAAQQLLENIPEQLQQLSDLLEDGGSPLPPR